MLELFPGILLPAALTALGVLLAGMLLVRPELVRRRSGAVIGAMALLGVPAFLLWVGMDQHVQHTKKTGFCLSCHSMLPYGESVTKDEEGLLAAVHFQNRYVSQETGCYACHTEYTMYGGLKAKIAGVQHVWAAYVGGVADPIELYGGTYANRECLRCHQGRPNFMAQPAHQGQLQEMREEDVSCLLCHGPVHGVEEGEVTEAIEGRREFRLPEIAGHGASR